MAGTVTAAVAVDAAGACWVEQAPVVSRVISDCCQTAAR